MNINNNCFPDLLFIRTFEKRDLEKNVNFEKNVGGRGSGGIAVLSVAALVFDLGVGIVRRCHPVEEEAPRMGKWSAHHTKNPEEEKC